MRLEQLRVRGLRCLGEVGVALDPALNVFTGANGAGKTSVLEAVFLLSHARSFRSGAKEALLQRGASQLSIFAELRHADGRVGRVGLGRDGVRWEAKLDGANVAIGQLVRECAVVCFEPGSHALIAGAAEERRRYLDWGVFHVEHEFLAGWRRYQRALKQRNSLLRSATPGDDDLFAPWEIELAQSAQQIDQQRGAYLDLLKPKLLASIGGLLPELGALELRYRRGWPEEQDLARQLREQRGRDLARGHTTLGAHRADWSIAFEHAPLREHLSRGQEKLTALACMLAQAELYAEHRGEWPIVCLDDLASELDQAHQAAVVAQLAAARAQVLLTGTELPQALQGLPARVFHVEQGELTRLL
ncbi:DNA recombination protein RecF [Rhodanobacter sp. FW510-R12]|uniref:DNA replication/repair protein RecF n=1 Tax=Rhodanobacter sp. FW106-PBR-LB-2-11 TaxID=1524463 RepID=UPI0007AA3609|nr:MULTISPECIES: DNA replication/repair protein RecF [unclassified Rhodanobacter]KZC16707.1 DNA recombination protein RecF [Rhodanobacter sp. FW104-R8]KZC27432.1 DNA recombination protein RecF [Rhodanobacter sp. FW510-T8]KZC31927.1 DNA recombination protein RecF [Rhodanobacter sp. FW510-R10]